MIHFVNVPTKGDGASKEKNVGEAEGSHLSGVVWQRYNYCTHFAHLQTLYYLINNNKHFWNCVHVAARSKQAIKTQAFVNDMKRYFHAQQNSNGIVKGEKQ